jgi:hypothetical protein
MTSIHNHKEFIRNKVYIISIRSLNKSIMKIKIKDQIIEIHNRKMLYIGFDNRIHPPPHLFLDLKLNIHFRMDCNPYIDYNKLD